MAMGAGRQEIVRYFMGESVLLAVVGGGLGVLLSSWALGLSTRFVPTEFSADGGGRAWTYGSWVSRP